jgi:histidyl-tRNA synthetase
MTENYRVPRGMHDILPEDEPYWSVIENAARECSENMGLSKITTSIIDFKSLFFRSVGEDTDIVQKEIFSVSKGSNNEDNNEEAKDELILRPEITAQIARAYIQYGMQTWPQPVRLFYLREPNFRYERPQAGRYRQFFQYGAEIYGSDDPMTDAHLMLLLWQILQKIGLAEKIVFDINNIGCKTCRPNIKKQITKFYKNHENELCTDCRERLKKNPLRILDCKNPECQTIAAEAPQLIDLICNECKNHFKTLLEYLDELNIPYNLNSQLVRGLDYYTRTVFEIREENDEKRQGVLAGGGRYDGLIEELGGQPTPAAGFAFGYERLVEKLKERKIALPEKQGPDILIVQLGDKAKLKALPLIQRLSNIGYTATAIPGKDSLRAQLRMADKFNIPIALIIGQREAFDNTAILRNMKEGVQETIDLDRLEKVLKRFAK